MHSRRGFLRKTLGAAWTGAALLEQSVFRATHARAFAADGTPSLFDIRKVADGVYAAIARPQVLLNCNAAIFENANDLLVVDTHSKPSAVTALVAQIRREVSPKPVRYVVNSHFHWDHSQGSPAYRKLAPEARIVSSDATRQMLAEAGASRLRDSLEQVRKSAAEYREAAGSASGEAKAVLATYARDAEAYLAEMRDYTPELPDLTFRDGLVLHDKAHTLHLMFRGRAHTAGDVVVYCPEKKAIATGDVLHGFPPYIGDGYPKEWPATLRGLAALEFDHVIGGHGEVQSGKERLQQKAAYIEELSALVLRARSDGVSLEALQKSATPDKLRSLAGGYREYLAYGSRYMPLRPGTTPQAFLEESVRSNLRDVYGRIEKS